MITDLSPLQQQFVTDRKVDEEIGTMTRFQADPDDLLPHIMGFGRGMLYITLVSIGTNVIKIAQ